MHANASLYAAIILTVWKIKTTFSVSTFSMAHSNNKRIRGYKDMNWPPILRKWKLVLSRGKPLQKKKIEVLVSFKYSNWEFLIQFYKQT